MTDVQPLASASQGGFFGAVFWRDVVVACLNTERTLDPLHYISPALDQRNSGTMFDEGACEISSADLRKIFCEHLTDVSSKRLFLSG